MQLVDEERWNIELRDLIHLQAGIIRMTDHDLRLARAAGRTFAGLCELPVTHLAQTVRGFVGDALPSDDITMLAIRRLDPLAL